MEEMKLHNFNDIKKTLGSALGTTDKVILCALITYRNVGTGKCFPKQQELADYIGMDRKTVNRSVKRLEKMGVVSTTIRNAHAPLNYTIDTDNLPFEDDATNVYQDDDRHCTEDGTSCSPSEGTSVVPRQSRLSNRVSTEKGTGNSNRAEIITEDSADAPSSSRPLNKRYKLWSCDCGEKECKEKQESVKKESDYSNRLRIRTGLLNGQLDWESVLALEYSAEDFVEWPEIEVLIEEQR